MMLEFLLTVEYDLLSCFPIRELVCCFGRPRNSVGLSRPILSVWVLLSGFFIALKLNREWETNSSDTRSESRSSS